VLHVLLNAGAQREKLLNRLAQRNRAGLSGGLGLPAQTSRGDAQRLDSGGLAESTCPWIDDRALVLQQVV
jgi:hypothetical protein